MREAPIAEATPPSSPLPLRQIVLGAVGVIIFITALTLGMNAIGIEKLQAFIADAGIFAPLAYIFIKTLTYIFAPLTSGPIQMMSGTLFNDIWLGVIYTLIGEVMGGSISFLLARRFGRPLVVRMVGASNIARIDEFYQQRLGGWRSLAVARLVLFSVWDFVSYAAGLAPVTFRAYVLVSIIVGAIPTFFTVLFGTYAIENPALLPLGYGLVGLGIAAAVLLEKLIARWRKGHDEKSP